MPVGVAGGVAASIGKVFWRFDDLCPRSLRPFVVRVDIGQIDEDALGCRFSLVSAYHSPFLATLPHHDALAIERHLAMRTAIRRRRPHCLGETEGAGEPVESRRNVAIENIGDDLGTDR